MYTSELVRKLEAIISKHGGAIPVVNPEGRWVTVRVVDHDGEPAVVIS